MRLTMWAVVWATDKNKIHLPSAFLGLYEIYSAKKLAAARVKVLNEYYGITFFTCKKVDIH